ncbi:murein hydrolase activator EnvC family protein [Polynucleobacter rarus]|jgi:lipoprotein NlpD|uniref:murein hydrolase activator EnvC family protein n=1 Tax=Polynucleobacter rarus TaxID=556055 RepID=UPI000D3E8E72|nr:M23 family metallopeptidase [Polynucleobacter rarus]
MFCDDFLFQQSRNKTSFSAFIFSKGILLLALMLIIFTLASCSASKPAPISDRTTSSSSSNANTNLNSVNSNPSVKVTPIAAPKPMIQKSNPREVVRTEPKTEPKSDTKTENPKPITPTETSFKLLKPTNAPVITPFNDTTSKGVEFSGKLGDSILAAADGRVIYSGSNLRTYGNLIILNHNNSYVTVYANNKTLLVKEGETVKRGQKIAEMGNSESDKVKLHFELRKNSKPIDPSSYFVEN